MLEYLASGILLGLAAGVAPGPLMALVLGQALRFGTREGLKVAAAPLLTDVPIVALATLLVATAAGTAGGLLGAISLAGAAGRSGGRLRGRACRAVMAIRGGLLLVLAARLAVEGLRLLGVLTV